MRNRPKTDAQRHTDKTVRAALVAAQGATVGTGRLQPAAGRSGFPAVTGTTEGTDDDGNTFTIYPFLTEEDSTNTDGPMTI